MSMQAVIPARAGGPEVLELVERPLPAPAAGQVLLKVAAAGVNRHDCNQRARGHGPAGSTDVLGLEVAGVVVAVGEGGDPSLLGRRVCALTDGGSYASHVLAETSLLFEWPEALSAIEAAALPEVLFTLQLNLVTLGGLRAGEWLLIHGGTSGIGMAGIPFAKALGAKVVVTAGSDEKCRRAEAQGAERAVNYRTEDFVAIVREITGGKGVNMVLDTVGGLYARQNLAALAMDGRVLHLSPAAPDYAVPLVEIMSKRARVMGSLLRAYPQAGKEELAKAIRATVWQRASSDLRPVIDSTFPLAEARAAHERMDMGTHIGKVVLVVDSTI